MMQPGGTQVLNVMQLHPHVSAAPSNLHLNDGTSWHLVNASAAGCWVNGGVGLTHMWHCVRALQAMPLMGRNQLENRFGCLLPEL